MSLLNYSILSSFPELLHFCTTRHGGVSTGNYGTFNISPFSGDTVENQQANLQILANKLDINPKQIIFPYQTHSANVKTIDNNFIALNAMEKQVFLHGVDALITNLAQICIGVTTADCVPILIYDKENAVVAAVHAGWRGTCSRIVEKTLLKMQAEFGTQVSDVIASIGVSISPEVYNVGEELIDEFEKNKFPVDDIFIRRGDHLFLDLWTANKWLLIQAGVCENQIEISRLCSFSQSRDFFSARKLGIQSGRMLSGVMLY